MNVTVVSCPQCGGRLPELTATGVVKCPYCNALVHVDISENPEYTLRSSKRDRTLPEHLEQRCIRDLEEGEVAYTTPWAVFCDKKRRLYIVGTYPAESESGGTVHLRVTRRGNEICVDRRTVGDYKYTPEEPHYAGVSERDYIPACFVPRI